jgi:hypothetical protein
VKTWSIHVLVCFDKHRLSGDFSSFNNLAEASCRNSEHTWNNGYSYCHVQNAPRKKTVQKCVVSPKDEHVGFNLPGISSAHLVQAFDVLYSKVFYIIDDFSKMCCLSYYTLEMSDL